MADQKHLNIIKQGVNIWNEWRQKEIIPDLCGADLNGAYLNEVDLSKVDLKGANLSRTNLRGANFNRANLSEINLIEANLNKAYLNNASLARANLKWANLSDAHLNEANLSWAKLAGTNLNNANLSGAKLGGADLSGAYLNNANLLRADLSGDDISDADLTEANLNNADLKGTILVGADLRWADLTEANLNNANLKEAKLSEANFSRADLSGADLSGADLSGADLNNVNLTEANLMNANFTETNLEKTNLTKCRIYGISTWNLKKIKSATQLDLIITRFDEPTITVDNLEVAQFIYLLRKNEKISGAMNSISRKTVLILGRFTEERKPVLDAIREKLRQLDYVPILFDFERPVDRDFTETIMTLTGMCRFIIADITNPKSSPLELQATVPNYMIPFVPIIQDGEKPFAMFKDLKGKYDWILDTLVYDSINNLIKVFEKAVLEPALEKHNQLMARKVDESHFRHIEDYM